MSDFKKWYNESTKKSSEPDPFWENFKQSGQNDPHQKYYKDLMSKMFKVTGALILLTLIFGNGQNMARQGRSVHPELENDY